MNNREFVSAGAGWRIKASKAYRYRSAEDLNIETLIGGRTPGASNPYFSVTQAIYKKHRAFFDLASSALAAYYRAGVKLDTAIINFNVKTNTLAKVNVEALAAIDDFGRLSYIVTELVGIDSLAPANEMLREFVFDGFLGINSRRYLVQDLPSMLNVKNLYPKGSQNEWFKLLQFITQGSKDESFEQWNETTHEWKPLERKFYDMATLESFYLEQFFKSWREEPDIQLVKSWCFQRDLFIAIASLGSTAKENHLNWRELNRLMISFFAMAHRSETLKAKLYSMKRVYLIQALRFPIPPALGFKDTLKLIGTLKYVTLPVVKTSANHPFSSLVNASISSRIKKVNQDLDNWFILMARPGVITDFADSWVFYVYMLEKMGAEQTLETIELLHSETAGVTMKGFMKLVERGGFSDAAPAAWTALLL